MKKGEKSWDDSQVFELDSRQECKKGNHLMSMCERERMIVASRSKAQAGKPTTLDVTAGTKEAEFGEQINSMANFL